MKASKIKLSELITYDDHQKAINSIELGWDNVIGGYKAWDSGSETFLTKTAKNKIDAINNRLDRLMEKELI